jgi:hypothetical protein
MSIDGKILEKSLQTEFNNTLKILYTMIKLVPFQGYNSCKSVSIKQYINRIKGKSHRIISIDSEKAFDKIQHHFMMKALNKLELDGMYLNIMKVIYIYDKSIANIVQNEEK